MQELSLNVLDIAQNSVRAGASLVRITLDEDREKETLMISVADDGCGMTEEQVKSVTNPFFTTRTTRKVGLGIPFFMMAAEATGGSLTIHSTPGKGTETRAFFHTGHIDMLPVGNMAETVEMLITMNPDMDFLYVHSVGNEQFTLDTREIKAVLEDVPINSPEVASFIKETLAEGEAAL